MTRLGKFFLFLALMAVAVSVAGIGVQLLHNMKIVAILDRWIFGQIVYGSIGCALVMVLMSCLADDSMQQRDGETRARRMMRRYGEVMSKLIVWVLCSLAFLVISSMAYALLPIIARHGTPYAVAATLFLFALLIWESGSAANRIVRWVYAFWREIPTAREVPSD